MLGAGVIGRALAADGSPAKAPETPPEYSVFAYLQRQLAENPPRLQVPGNATAVRAWQQEMGSRLAQILGLDVSKPVPLRPRVIATYQRYGYKLEHVVFSSEIGADVPAYVLIPDGVDRDHRGPAVLCLQGVVPGGKDELAGEMEHNPAAAAGIKRFHDDFARQFARAGLVALAIDLRFDGERAYHSAQDPFGLNERLPAIALATKYAQMNGQSFFGLNLFDARRALDYLETRPEIVPGAIGCAGFSLGSTLAAWLATIDRRVGAVALEGSWPSWRRLALRSLQDGTHVQNGKPTHWMVASSYQSLPGFLREMDLNLTVAAVAPTPMMLSYESDTPWVYADQAEAERDILPVRQAYAAFGATENLKVMHVNGGHYWRPESIVPWMTDRLRILARASR